MNPGCYSVKSDERERILKIVREQIGCTALSGDHLPDDTPLEFFRELWKIIEHEVRNGV